MAPRRRFDAVLVTCEHGGNLIPPRYRELFRGQKSLLATHRGYDIGALPVAKALAKAWRAPLFFATTSRLVIDLNRSLSHKTVYSQLTCDLSSDEKDRIVAQHYTPYRSMVEEWIQDRVSARKSVLHLSVHSFTPELHGEVRNAEIGLLYDPQRPLERAFAKDLDRELQRTQEIYRIRRNYPYLGYADGFQTYLRKHYSARLYAGLEIEMNQGITQTRPGQKSMIKVFSVALEALGF